MKRLIISLAICCNSFLCGMEANDLNIIINGTTVSLIQGNPYKPEQENAIMIAGTWQQERLHEPRLCFPIACGDIYKSPYGNCAYVQKELKKISNDGPPRPNAGVDLIELKNTLLHVVEPVLYKIKFSNTWFYRTVRRINENEIEDPDYTGDQALIEARFDLAHCYKNILEKSHVFFSKNITHQERNLALPSISTQTLNKSTGGVLIGMPYQDAVSIACLKVVGFLAQEQNKDLYNVIQFIVGPNDFELYYKYFKRFIDLVAERPDDNKNSFYYEEILKNLDK